MKFCKRANCTLPIHALGLCAGHYRHGWYLKHKDLTRERAAAWRRTNKKKLKISQNKYRRTPKGRYVMAKYYATVRGHEFTISRSHYMELISKPCHYCNGYFPPTITRIGLDRLDSNLGYIESNVVSCCVICNRVKSDIFTPQETFAMIKTVLKMRKQK